jgi:YegS C-terminal NAD kinase beta sandwich-like domain
MTIRKGSTWGEPFSAEPEVVAQTDAEVAAAADRGAAIVGLTGGDLYRTVGGRGLLQTIAPIDLGIARFNGLAETFAAHVVVRSRFWRGPVAIVMNAQFIGRWDMAPRSHPNDGRLDVFEADLSVGDSWKAWRRLKLGTHLPHPGIRFRQLPSVSLRFDTAREIYVDGTHCGSATTLDVVCRADALSVAF